MNVIVKEEINKLFIVKIIGNVVIILFMSIVELDGFKFLDDKGIVSYFWIWDEGSLVVGEVLNYFDYYFIFFFLNLVEGIYMFYLKVIDVKGESDIDWIIVEVKFDFRKNNLVEIILDINVS